MCIGVPVQVVEESEFMALCRDRNGREEQVNMMLIGSQPVDTWIVAFLGLARDVISEKEAELFNKALDGLSSAMSGEEIDVEEYFPGWDAAGGGSR